MTAGGCGAGNDEIHFLTAFFCDFPSFIFSSQRQQTWIWWLEYAKKAAGKLELPLFFSYVLC